MGEMIDAFTRVRDREKKEFENRKIDYKRACDLLDKFVRRDQAHHPKKFRQLESRKDEAHRRLRVAEGALKRAEEALERLNKDLNTLAGTNVDSQASTDG